MIRRTRFAVFHAIVILAACLEPNYSEMCIAQNVQDELIANLAVDTAAIVQIRNPVAVVDCAERMFDFDDKTRTWLEKWFVDETVGVSSTLSLQSMMELREKIRRIAEDARQITLVIHTLQKDNIEFSLVFEGLTIEEPALSNLFLTALQSLTEMESLLGNGLFSMQDGPWFDHAKENPFDPSRSPDDPKHADFSIEEGISEPDVSSSDKRNPGLEVLPVGQFLILTNSADRWKTTPKKKLGESRRFQTIWKTFSGNSDIVCYAAPDRVDFELLGFPTQISDSWRTNEIASVGGAVVVSNDNDGRPAVVAKMIAYFTLPRRGLAKYWATASEIDSLPVISFPFYGMSYERFDPAKRFQASKDMQKVSQDFVAPEAKQLAYSGTLSVRYLANYDRLPGLSESLLGVRRVDQFEPAMEWMEQQIANLRNYPEIPGQLHLRESGNDVEQYRRTFQETEEAALKKCEETRARRSQIGTLSVENLDSDVPWIDGLRREGMSLGKEWLAIGDMLAIDSFFESNVSQNFSTDYCQPVREQAEQLQRVFKLNRPFAMEVLSPRSWSVSANWWIDRWSFENQNKIADMPPESRLQTLAMTKTAIASAVFNKSGSQLVLYSQNDNQMTVLVAIYGSVDHLFGQTGTAEKFRLIPRFFDERFNKSR